ncbi:HAD family hydrolase [Natronobeatus ordinarius]|uniref:HAD family hydrolase n=1 Tax=Natronobeatus ordinarius TaxID=2963433 RepID=UPI0020CF65E3|nr:HAD-IA family hydrolase [Natronobeatus ordinarius]
MTPPLLFDMDGVLLEGRGTDPSVYDRAADAALEELGVDAPVDARRLLRTYEYADVETGCTMLELDPKEFWRLKEAHASQITHARLLSGERRTYDDLEVVRTLGADVTLALVTNNRHATAEFVALHFELPFDAVRGRDPTPEGFRRRKPRPDYLLETMDALGVADGIYVGDRETDVIAARKAGLEPAYLRRPHNHDAPLPDGAAYELESLAALPTTLR